MSSEQVPPEVAAVGPARAPGRRLGAIAVLALLQLPWPSWLFPSESLSAQALRELVFWLMTVLLLAYVLLVERRPLRSIGLVRPTWRSLPWGVGGAVVTVAGAAFFYLVIVPALGLSAAEKQMGEVMALPLWFLLGLVTRAAVFEELCYRGFAIERIAELSGRRWLAALASLALFTFAHLAFWGWTHLIIAGYGGLVLTALYLLRRDLASNMLAHWLTNGIGFLLS
jgi:membrane protease YdiL (CAAX protease family)